MLSGRKKRRKEKKDISKKIELEKNKKNLHLKISLCKIGTKGKLYIGFSLEKTRNFSSIQAEKIKNM